MPAPNENFVFVPERYFVRKTILVRHPTLGIGAIMTMADLQKRVKDGEISRAVVLEGGMSVLQEVDRKFITQ